MKYTIKQRREIYEKVIGAVGSQVHNGICYYLREFINKELLLCEVGNEFPEFWKVKAEMIGAHPYSVFKNDNQRYVCLEKSIQLCDI